MCRRGEACHSITNVSRAVPRTVPLLRTISPRDPFGNLNEDNAIASGRYVRHQPVITEWRLEIGGRQVESESSEEGPVSLPLFPRKEEGSRGSEE
ncbi:hypothetical protein PUN28_017109 [Cardiocondyla obscurior]|uniref:Uncharacterized protein n=1 Tax=Cardiocondyla obscurior TaxID=286306 RepID=A0AAW2EP66_9HYME